MVPLDESEHAPLIMAELQDYMNKLRVQYGTTPQLVQSLNELFSDFRDQCRLLGVDFPKLKVIVLPSVAQVYCLRADFDQKSVETHIVNIVTENPTVSMVELAQAIAQAYPHLRPAHLH